MEERLLRGSKVMANRVRPMPADLGYVNVFSCVFMCFHVVSCVHVFVCFVFDVFRCSCVFMCSCLRVLCFWHISQSYAKDVDVLSCVFMCWCVFMCFHVFMSSCALLLIFISIICKRCRSLRAQKRLEAQLACDWLCVLLALLHSGSKHPQPLLEVSRRTW